MADFGLSAYDASLLVTEPAVGHYYEAVLADGTDAKAAANWIINNVFTRLNEAELPREAIASLKVTPDMLAELIQLTQRGVINSSTAVKVLESMWDSGERATAVIEREGLAQINDPDAIAALVDKVLADSERMVSDYLGGKEKLFGALVGKAMGEARGKANPQLLKDILQAKLDARRA
jgi:aspartyl-tRNA(Asn)/glutamyl-tRNA(Gln) amidotransferase subunit B